MNNNATRLYAMIGQATRIVRYPKAIFVAGLLLAASVLFVPVYADGPKIEVPKADVAAATGEAPSFDAVIKPYLEQHCIRCHGAKVQKGKLSLEKTGDQFTTAKEVELWLSILDMLSFNDMPPPDEPQPEALETAKVVDWIKQRLEETGEAEAYRKKLISPEYGNWVSHEELFSGDIQTPPFSPSRLWRFSGDIFDARNFHRAQSPFSYVTKETGIRDYAATSQVDRSTVQMIMINAEQWLEHREKRGEFKHFADDQPTPVDQVLEQTVRQEFKQIIRRNARDDEAAKYLAFLKKNIEDGGNLDGLKTLITAMFLAPEAIYRSEFGLGPEDEHGRRQLAPEEIAYALAYALTDKGPDETPAIKNAFKAGELNNPEDVARVVRQVLDEEMGTGQWDRPSLPRIMRFFEEYFGFNRVGLVFKDNERKRMEGIPRWSEDQLVYDAQLIIEYQLRRDKNFIPELLTGNGFYIAHPGDNEYAKEMYDKGLAQVLQPDYVETQLIKRKEELDRNPNLEDDKREKGLRLARNKVERNVRRYEKAIADGFKPIPNIPFSPRSRGLGDTLYIAPYNLPHGSKDGIQNWDWQYEQPIQMPKDQRAGILTHPAWLASYSFNDGNDPIHRGIWVREKLLAGVIQDVPPDVDAKVPTNPHKTLRERMDILRDERCWVCHRKINPLGETFEMFDDWGRYRTHDYFDEDGVLVTRRDATFDRLLEQKKLTARPIDATGAITGSGDPAVDGEVKNAVEMMHRLGNSDRARQSFIRHLFRYFMGRNEMLSDSKTLIEAEQAYLDSDGSFKALVVSLLSSDSFLYRR